jgi:putative esterase
MPIPHAASPTHNIFKIAAAICVFSLATFSPLFAQSGLVTTVSDDFNRNNGALGGSWTSLPGGGLTILAGQATGGAAGQFTGSYRSAESFNPNQYSEIEITATPFSSSTHQWIGASVRNQPNGDLYVGIYWNNLGGTPVLRLYKKISGNYTQLGTEYVSGTLAAGARLKTVVTGTTISVLLDGTLKISVYDADLGSGSPGVMAFDTATADNWNAGDFSAASGAASDNFDRIGTSLGADWTGLPDGALALLSNQVSGAAGRVSGSIRTAELYDTNQYSEIKTTATQLYGNQWIGATVRSQANGDLYLGMYWWNSGNPVLRLYRRIYGGFTQLGPQYASGALPPGTALKLMARGTTISFLQDGVERISVFDNSLYGGAPGMLAFDTATADNWSAGTANFEAHFLGIDANGVESYNMSSNYNGYGPHVLRVLRPNNPAPNKAHNLLFALPVTEEGNNTYGNGMDTLRLLNAHNDYNVTIIEPSFPLSPWYADSPLDPNYRFESFMVLELQPWARANLATAGQEKNWLLGFSKSGVGGLALILKHPELFTVAAAWDFPADMSTYTQFDAYPNYGTEDNFQNNYRLTSSFVNARKAPFLNDNRLWVSGYNAFQADLNDFDTLLTSLGVQHTKGVASLESHSWNSFWVPGALAGLSDASIAFSGAPPSGGGGSGTPATAISITVAISAVNTNSAVAAGYLVNESSTAPAANAAGWMGTPPPSYTFSSPGTKTLYVWVKDAAGNVSLSSSASVTITLASQ